MSFHPRLMDVLKGYGAADFLADLAAGVTVGIVALPLAIAFAIASGLPPSAGINTAIVAGFIVSALGGSRVQIGGPAGAFIVIVYGMVQRYGVGSLLVAAMGSGCLLLAMGVFRLGGLVRFVPVPIVLGFTNGIAVLIGLSQVRDFLGLKVAALPAEFFSQLHVLWQARDSVSLPTLALGGGSLLLVLVWPKGYVATASPATRLLARVPGTLIVLVLGTVLKRLFELDVQTLGGRFGALPSALPLPVWPEVEWSSVRQLFGPMVTLALLGAVESLLCARVADNLTGDRHDPNQELMAQGLANIFSPLLGGFCATGTIARTVTNIRSGARSPVAGIVHSLTLLTLLMAAAPLAAGIPLCSLAAILLAVAWNMGDWRAFGRMRHFSWNYRLILLSVFVLTIVIDLTVAVETGLLLASLFFITRVSSLTRVDAFELPPHLRLALPPGSVECFSIVGSLFFASVSRLEALGEPDRQVPPYTLLETGGLISLDTTGVEALETLAATLARRGGALVLCGLREQPASLLRRTALTDQPGVAGIHADVEAAVGAIAARIRGESQRSP